MGSRMGRHWGHLPLQNFGLPIGISILIIEMSLARLLCPHTFEYVQPPLVIINDFTVATTNSC